MKTFPAALMLVLLLAPSGFTLQCYVCDGEECNEKYDAKSDQCGAEVTSSTEEASTASVDSTTPVDSTTVSVESSTPVGSTTVSVDSSTPVVSTTVSVESSTVVDTTTVSVESSTVVDTTTVSVESSTVVDTTTVSVESSTVVDTTTVSVESSTVVETTTVSVDTSKPEGGEIDGSEKNQRETVLVKRNLYSFFGRKLREADDLYRCVKVIYKVADVTKTKRGCHKVDSVTQEAKEVCQKFSGQDPVECGVCNGDLCNSAKISQMSKALALVFLLPLLRFFY